MICIILAAGYATRLYPLTERIPKPLLKIQGKTILDWLLQDLMSTGLIDRYIVVSNHKFYSDFFEWARDKSKILVLDDGSTQNENRIGAVKDIAFAVNKLDIIDDILLVAGDNVLDFSLKELINHSIQNCQSSVMRYFEKDNRILKKSGVIVIDKDENILEMVEKAENPPSNWIVPPFYFIREKDVHLINEAIKSGCNTDAPGSLIAWMCNKTTISSLLMSGRRFDIGDIISYDYANKEFKGIK